MTFEDIANLIKSFSLPFAYYQFPKDTAQAPPFICFFYGSTDDFFADNRNYKNMVDLNIELYTENKDFELEQKIEKILISNEMPFEKEETYLDSERLQMVTYMTSVAINYENEV